MAIPPARLRLRLSNMVAANTEPVLTMDELDELLAMTALRDADGLAPSDALWTPTYNLNRAAVEGWRWKAGKASDTSSVRTGDLTFEDASIYTHCEKMIAQYQRKLFSSVSVAPLVDDTEVEDEEDEEA